MARASQSAGHEAGVLIDDTYRLLDEIGRGGMGTVFRAHDEALDRLVAVKFLLPELQRESRLVEQLRREARAMARVTHTNVVQIYAIGRHGASDYIVTELVEGQSAETLVDQAHDRGEQLELELALELSLGVSLGLGAVHEAGVVHRDVKPANVLVDELQRRALLTDFGIGRRVGAAERSMSRVDVGTPAYLAPELYGVERRTPEMDRRADIYALGLTIYELLTAQHPFPATSLMELVYQQATEPPTPPSRHRPGLPEDLDRVLLAALSKDPESRPERASEIAEVIGSWLGHPRSTPSPPTLGRAAIVPPTPEPTPEPPRPTAEPTEGHRRVSFIVASREEDQLAALARAASRARPGAHVVTTNDAATVLDLSHRAAPDVLVAPADGPGLNGVELMGAITADPQLRQTRVVLTLGSGRAPEDWGVLSQLGAARVLVLPWPESKLAALLARVLEDTPSPQSFDVTAERTMATDS